MLCAGLPAASNQLCSTAWAIAASTAASSWPRAGPINRESYHTPQHNKSARGDDEPTTRTAPHQTTAAPDIEPGWGVARAQDRRAPLCRFLLGMPDHSRIVCGGLLHFQRRLHGGAA